MTIGEILIGAIALLVFIFLIFHKKLGELMGRDNIRTTTTEGIFYE